MSMVIGIPLAILLLLLAMGFIWLAVSADGIRSERHARTAEERAEYIEARGSKTRATDTGGIGDNHGHAPRHQFNWYLGAVAVLLLVLWGVVMLSMWSSHHANLHVLWALFLVSLAVMFLFYFGGVLSGALLRKSAQ